MVRKQLPKESSKNTRRKSEEISKTYGFRTRSHKTEQLTSKENDDKSSEEAVKRIRGRRSAPLAPKYNDESISSEENNETKKVSKLSEDVTPKQTDDEDKSSDEVTVVSRRVTRQTVRKVEIETKSGDEILEEQNIFSDDDEKPARIVRFKSNNAMCYLKQAARVFGVILFIVLLPAVVLYTNKMAESGGKLRVISLSVIKKEYFMNCKVMGIVIGWLIYLLMLAALPIGWVKRAKIEGVTQQFRCNGAISLMVTLILLAVLYQYKYVTTRMFLDHYYDIIGSSIILCIITSLLLFVKSFFVPPNKLIDKNESAICGFLIGRELKPKLFNLDLRFFYEFRPGFIGWALTSVLFCVKEWERKGLGEMNPSLVLICGAQFVYCLDALIFEGDLVTRSYMTKGRFGFFHCFGSQVFLPFMFSLTSRAVLLNEFRLPLKCLIGTAVANLFGYIMYRASNCQKNSFRRDPYSVHLTHLKTITTDSGYQLLVTGWWGVLRHPNYLADIIMGLCWSLYSGIGFTVCWLYPVYFMIFITIHWLKEEQTCEQKHGRAWQRYKSLVKL